MGDGGGYNTMRGGMMGSGSSTLNTPGDALVVYSVYSEVLSQCQGISATVITPRRLVLEKTRLQPAAI